jgi:excisionase family DNA binding protein
VSAGHAISGRPDALAYSVPDAGRVVGLSRTTMWRLIASGELQTFKIGGRTLVAREDLEVLMKLRPAPVVAALAPARRVKPAPPEPTCGVYILLLEDRPVYVGRSTSMITRLADHKASGRPHERAEVIPCDPEASVWLERELIRTLQPEQNVLRYQRHSRAMADDLKRRGLK